MNVLIYGFSGKILGGIETFILNMNEHMSPHCVFDYIIDGEVCVYRNRIEERGGKVFFVPSVKSNPIGYFRRFKKILKEQKKIGTKVFYIQLFSMANMLPALLANYLGYKVVLHAHNNGLQSKSKIYGIIHRIGKRITKHGDYVRFTNSKLSSDFMFGNGIKSELIYNAIDTAKFSFHQEIRDRVRNEQGCDNKVVIGFVGRFMLQKNPVFMIQVFANLLQMNKDCELWIIGEGELREAMIYEINKYGIANTVKWLGRRNDVEQLMQGMDLLLQPSIFEGLGIVLVEAQATGLPVVSTAKMVPEEAAVTPLIKFIDLNNNPYEWAVECMEQVKAAKKRERIVDSTVFPDYFDINIEAKRLEQLLAGI